MIFFLSPNRSIDHITERRTTIQDPINVSPDIIGATEKGPRAVEPWFECWVRLFIFLYFDAGRLRLIYPLGIFDAFPFHRILYRWLHGVPSVGPRVFSFRSICLRGFLGKSSFANNFFMINPQFNRALFLFVHCECRRPRVSKPSTVLKHEFAHTCSSGC